MPFVKFKVDREVQDEHRGTAKATVYRAGQVYELSQASADRWIARGIAEPAEAPKAVESKVKGVKTPRAAPPPSPTPPSSTEATVPDGSSAGDPAPTDPANDPAALRAARRAAFEQGGA